MTPTSIRSILALPVAAVLAAMPLTPAWSQQPAAAPSPLLVEMEGRWAVEQTTWDGAGAPAKKGPPAVAVRRIPAGGGYIEEEMTARTPGDKPFTRTAQINYNMTARTFEYSTVDTRAPQQMHYRSQVAAAGYRGTFVAAEWGGRKNVAFAYRVALSPLTDDRQRLQIFFRPLVGRGAEFLATQYDYQRMR